MKIVVIVGSKQLDGNTDRLADYFIKGALQSRNTVEKIHLRRYMVNPCLGCNMCFNDDKPCIQNDDMGAIYAAFQKCDMVVFATPLYFLSFSSALKSVIDRLYALSGQNFEKLPKKDVALLVTAHDKGSETFHHISTYYRNLFINHLKWRDRGMILAGGCGGTLAPKIIHDTIYLEEARKLGASIV